MLYKARIALFEATWEKYHAGTPFAGEGNVQAYMEEAARMAKLVIDSQLFDLDNMGVEDGYHTLFNRWGLFKQQGDYARKKFDRITGILAQ